VTLKPSIAAIEPYLPGQNMNGAVKLSSNENPLGPSPKAVRSIQKALDNIHRYPDGSATALRVKLAELWKLNSDRLIITNGSDEFFTLLAAAFIGQGENALSVRETFSQYRFAVRLFGAEIRESSLIEGRYNLDGMLRLVNKKTRLVFVCNPNNPTGCYSTHREITTFLRSIRKDIIVVLDEAYADFADKPDFPDARALLDEFPNLVVTRTFSKLYGLAGLRVGYAMGNAEVIAGARRASMPFNVNRLAQIAAGAALEDAEHREKTLKLVHEERNYLSGELKSRGIFHYPTQANFLCFDLKTETAKLWDAIAFRGIVLRDLKSFDLPHMARYTIGTRKNNRRLVEILDEINLK